MTNQEIAELYERHHETVYRVCFMYMKNSADTEDALQNTFINLIKSGQIFQNTEHEKAWLIKTASNLCKNNLKHWWRKREPLEECDYLQGKPDLEHDETLDAVIKLPDKYKSVVYLYYYEGYKTGEIAEMLRKPQSTVRNLLREARIILKKEIGDINE